MTRLTSNKLDKLKALDLVRAKDYPYTLNSYRYLQFGFYHGDSVMFVGQNPGISQENVPREKSQALYEDFDSSKNYERYLKEYEAVLHLQTCPMGRFIDDIYSSDWSDISFTNLYKNPFIEHKVDVKDNLYYDNYLKEQIKIIQPHAIVTIGKVPKDAINRLKTNSGKDSIDLSISILNVQHYSYWMRTNTYKENVNHYRKQLEWLIK